ncbi:hypothetical protein QR680_017522 [Steinernema hermaphroditum]|uniref:Uncharacterized protein n=1 Tax=Steinernema hermaphroditum TaxID=289476 RepID=A0AA39HFV6_9BILA|nr:hypothetical protein QR680_017522 [Steinernema hermaphroditum]
MSTRWILKDEKRADYRQPGPPSQPTLVRHTEYCSSKRAAGLRAVTFPTAGKGAASPRRPEGTEGPPMGPAASSRKPLDSRTSEALMAARTPTPPKPNRARVGRCAEDDWSVDATVYRQGS